MKKILIAFLLSLSCACAITAVGCGKNSNGTNSSISGSTPGGANPPRMFNVDFQDGEGYTFISETEDNGSVAKGDTLTFSVDVGAFYTGSPVVYVNGDPIAPNNEGVYSIEMVVNSVLEIMVSE